MIGESSSRKSDTYFNYSKKQRGREREGRGRYMCKKKKNKKKKHLFKSAIFTFSNFCLSFSKFYFCWGYNIHINPFAKLMFIIIIFKFKHTRQLIFFFHFHYFFFLGERVRERREKVEMSPLSVWTIKHSYIISLLFYMCCLFDCYMIF
jgi:hypothetical protein